MSWRIEYAYSDVEQFILKLPPGLAAKYLHLAELMLEFGANLGMPRTRSMSDGLFELRAKGREGIARIFIARVRANGSLYCTALSKNRKRRRSKKSELPDSACRR